MDATRPLVVLLAAAAMLLAPGVAVSGAAPAAPDGAEVYRDHCSRCHSPRAPSDLDAAAWRVATFHMRTRAYLDRAEVAALEGFLAPAALATPAGGGVLANPLVASKCVTCHPPERIEAAVGTRRTVAGWLETLDRMRTYGAPVSPAEAREIAAWLAQSSPTP